MRLCVTAPSMYYPHQTDVHRTLLLCLVTPKSQTIVPSELGEKLTPLCASLTYVDLSNKTKMS